MKNVRISMILLFTMVAAFGMTWADAGNNVMRFGVQFVSPTGELKDIDLNETVQADNALGFVTGFEHVFFDRVGFDVNLGYSKHDVELEQDGETVTIGDIKMMMPFTAGINFHMIRNNFVDLYAGPFAGYVLFGDIDPSEPEMSTVSIDNDFALGGVLGFDVAFTGKGFIFTSALKYMKAKAQPDMPDAEEIDIDPWVLQIGFGYRF